MLDKKKSLLILGTAVAFLVVMTVLILLVLKFQLFNFQDPQQPSEPAGQVMTPDGDQEQPNDQNEEEKPSGNDEEVTQQPEGDKEEGGFKVTVDDEDDPELQPGQGGNSISFEDLLNAAQKNEG